MLVHPPHRRDVINGVWVTHNVGIGTTEKYGTWDFTLALKSSYLWGNNFCFAAQNDVVSKYYLGMPGNIFEQTFQLITNITWHELYHELSLNSLNKSVAQ